MATGCVGCSHTVLSELDAHTLMKSSVEYCATARKLLLVCSGVNSDCTFKLRAIFCICTQCKLKFCVCRLLYVLCKQPELLVRLPSDPLDRSLLRHTLSSCYVSYVVTRCCRRCSSFDS